MKSKIKCSTPYCKNNRIKGKTKCSKCNMRWLKEHHPETYFFNILRGNAKRRGKEFNLTLEEFRKFCKETNYLEFKGKTASSASIDRIRAWEGYHKDNIQILTLSDNVKKQRMDVLKEICPF